MIIVSIVLILGLIAIYAVLNLNAAPTGDGGSANMTDIVIVIQPIARGAQITADALGTLSYPTDQVIATMITNPADATGRLARFDLQPGEPLMTTMIVDEASQVVAASSDTSLQIPAGMVAFPIPIDRFSSLAYGLRKGDHVNVIATMLLVDLDSNFQSSLPNNTAGLIGPGGVLVSGSESAEQTSTQLVLDPLIDTLTAQIVSGGGSSSQGQVVVDDASGQQFYVVPSEPQRPRLVSQTLLQDIVVLHIGNFLYTDENGDVVENAYGVVTTTEDGTTGTKPPPDVITLIVTPQDAVTLNYLIYAGAELNLALRPANDTTLATTEAVTLEYLLTAYNIPVPTKLPYGLEPRIDSLFSPTQQDVFPQPASSVP